MRLDVYWLQLAEDKLDDIYTYYLEKAGLRTARKLIRGIVQATLSLENQPEIGQTEEYLEHRKEKFRYLVHGNYKIVYWINHESRRVEIANVFDARQNTEKLGETKPTEEF